MEEGAAGVGDPSNTMGYESDVADGMADGMAMDDGLAVTG